MHSRQQLPVWSSSACLSVKNYSGGFVQEEYHLIQTIPYILVLAGGIIGLNVFLVLITGIVSGSIIMIATGMIVPTDLLGNMGDGAAGMFETSMVAITGSCNLCPDQRIRWICSSVILDKKGIQGKKRRTSWNGAAGWSDGYCNSK